MNKVERFGLAVLAVCCGVWSSNVSAATIFSDDYGTDGGHVSYGVRWANNSGIGASSIVDNSTSFTASKSSGGLMQIQIPSSNVGDGTASPFQQSLTYSVSLQANPDVSEVRFFFINPNVSSLVGGSASRAWAWTFLSDGRLFDGFGGGTLLTNSFNAAAHHDFSLTINDPLSGSGLLNIDGGNQNYVIPIGGESDTSPHAFIRSVDGGAGQSLTIDHTSLTTVPEPSSLTVLATSIIGVLSGAARRRSAGRKSEGGLTNGLL